MPRLTVAAPVAPLLVALVLITSNDALSAPKVPTVRTCAAAWNETLPYLIRGQMLSAQVRRAVVGVRLDKNGVSLVHPLCTFAFPLAGHRILYVEAVYAQTSTAWLMPVELRGTPAGRPNAVVKADGSLRLTR